MPLIRNFGCNVALWAKLRLEPRTDEEVLEILRQHRDKRIRCIGALHSWSRIVQNQDVVIDMRHFDSVSVVTKGEGAACEGARVRLGAGCTIKRALDRLEPHGLTLPALGAITKQTIAGAISTGTHGSGAQSLSHFVEEVRLAGYDPDSGNPALLRLRGGDELLAARCALGGLGVILDVVLRARANYCIEEQFRAVALPEDARAGLEEWPLQQFFLVPWKWRYYVYRRKALQKEEERQKLKLWPAFWHRLRLLVCIDIAQHAALKFLMLPLALILRNGLKRLFLRLASIREYDRVDYCRHVLTLRHDLFCHVEMEVFVPGHRLADAMDAVRAFIEFAAARRVSSARIGAELDTRFARLHGRWTHHYPVSFRYVLPEETLLSMASKRNPADGEPWVAISFFNYGWPTSRRFADFARAVAAFFIAEFEARLHWGKLFPRNFREALEEYPGYPRFEKVRSRYDPAGVFWTTNL